MLIVEYFEYEDLVDKVYNFLVVLKKVFVLFLDDYNWINTEKYNDYHLLSNPYVCQVAPDLDVTRSPLPRVTWLMLDEVTR